MLNTRKKYKHSRYFTKKLWISEKGGTTPSAPVLPPNIQNLYRFIENTSIHDQLENQVLCRLRWTEPFLYTPYKLGHLESWRKSDDTSNQYIVCGLLDSVAKIPKIPISENSGAPNAFWGDKTDTLLSAFPPSTFQEKINLITIKMLEILRLNLGTFLSFEN